MSVITKTHRASQRHTPLQQATAAVASILASTGKSYYNQDLAGQVIGFESLTDVDRNTVNSKKMTLMAELRTSPLATVLLKGIPNDRLEFALESAATTIMMAADAKRYYSASRMPVDTAGVLTVMPLDGASPFALESFDPVTIEKYLAATVVANAQTAVLGSFEDAFFRQILVPAGEHGIDMSITIPQIYSNTKRDNAGAVFSIKKTSIVEAILNPSVLESFATTLYPQSTSATEPAELVANAVIPTMTKTIAGTDVTTRPLLFGAEVDVIGLSNAPGLISQKVFDETDQLDPIMNLGVIYYQITAVKGATTVTSIFSADISGQHGAQLTQVASGQLQQFQTAATFGVSLNRTSVPVAGDDQATFLAQIEDILSLAAGTEFTIGLTIKLSAEANTNTGYFVTNANNPTLAALYDANDQPASLAPFSVVGTTFTITPIGYMPNLRRSNSNLRNNGTIIDNNTTINFRYPVQLQAPITSQTAIGSNNVVTIETLGATGRIRNSGNAVNVLLKLEEILIAGNGIPAQFPMAGELLVKPTYVVHTVDVDQVVANLSSKDALENLRGHLTTNLTLMANELLIKSHYLAALEAMEIPQDGYEIIVVTDPTIASHIWESGDTRTFGDNRSYTIATSNNEEFLGKIYMSFRRKVRDDNMHPLDFGAMLVTPSLTFELPINRNNRTVNEVITVPRANPHITLPVLGRLNVNNLDSIYVTN